MKRSVLGILLGGLFCLSLSSCKSMYPYENYTTYGATRRLSESRAPKVTKIVFSPFIFIPETLASPVTVYMDCAEDPPTGDDAHIYLSYIGTKKIRSTDLKKGYKICAGVPVVIIDTLWFPVAGVMDTLYVLSE